MRRLIAWILRRRVRRELHKELQFHLYQHTEDLMASGVSAGEAKRRARLELGGLDQIAESIRDDRPGVWIEQVLRDVRDASRSLRRTPGLTAGVVAMIALVIGGNTTIFSIIHGILTKPAPGVQARRLVTLDLVVNGRPYDGGNSYPNYLDYAAQSTTVHPLVVADFARFTLTVPNGSYAVRGDLVSTNYFDTLGVQPIVGRTFAAEDDRSAASVLPTVISERLWQRQFASIPNIVGQALVLNGHVSVIVGVAPPSFTGAVLGESSDIWVPLLLYMRVHHTEREVNDRSTLRMWIFGRLAPGQALADARAEFAAISRRLQTAYPETNRGQVVVPITYSAIATGSLLSRQGNYLLTIFAVITTLTVLIVCANVANLMLARAAGRQRELAVRQSLGASRMRIVRMLLAEGVLVSSVAWATACVAALVIARALSRLLPPDPSGTTLNADFTPDWNVAAYAMTLALMATVAFTLAPAIRAWRQDVLVWLKAGEHSVVQGRSALSSALVIVQLAFAVVLLTGAGLAYRSLSAINHLELGYRTDHLLLASVNTAGSAATPAVNRVVLERLRDRIRVIPGVVSVSHARWLSGWSEPVRRRDTDNPVRADQNFVGTDYLGTLGLAPLAGREFVPGEGNRADHSQAVINQHLAETLWPDGSPVGQSMRVGEAPQTVEIVGVMPNALLSGFRRDANPNVIFRSAQQEPSTPGETTFYIRYAGSLNPIASALGPALREVDANVPIVSVRTMDAELDGARWPVRAISTLLTAFAIGSLLIAAIGQYGVVAFITRRRTRDFGVRIALGASSSQVVASVLRDGLRMTIVGLLSGLLLSLVAALSLRGLLYGIGPIDAPTYLGVFFLLASASVTACYLPARRATRIDPMQALRTE